MPSDDPIIIGEGSVMRKIAYHTVTPNWRDVLKRWSFWLGTLGTAVTAFAVYAPEIALQAWLMMPPDLKSALPVDFVKYFGLGLFIAANIASFIKQRNIKQAAP